MERNKKFWKPQSCHKSPRSKIYNSPGASILIRIRWPNTARYILKFCFIYEHV